MITLSKKQLLFGLVLLLSGGAAGFLYNGKTGNALSHSELFELKRNCAKLAQEFAQKNTRANAVFETRFWVLQSDYNIERKSCFGEFDKLAEFSPGKSFLDYQIYDLLTGRQIAAMTATDKDPATSEWTDYFLKQEPEYSKVRKQIFGSP